MKNPFNHSFAFCTCLMFALAFVSPFVSVSGTNWGTPTVVASDNHPYETFWLDFAMNDNGNAVAVWTQFDGGVSNIWSSTFDYSEGWLSPVLLEFENSGFAKYPEVAMDQAGDAVAVWSQDNGTRDRLGFPITSIWANRFAKDSGWTGATLLETGDLRADSPRVAFDPRGNAFVVWSEEGAIWYNRFVLGGGWEAATAIVQTEGATNPELAVGKNGSAVVAWQQNNNIWAKRYTAGTGWSETAPIGQQNAGGAQQPQVVVGPQGNAIAAWQQVDNCPRIWANVYRPEIGWNTPSLIQNDDSACSEDFRLGSRSPQLGVDPQGNGIAVWEQFDETRFNVWFNRLVAEKWQTPTVIEMDDPPCSMAPPRAGSILPDISVDPSGNVMAVWMHCNGRDYELWGNRFDFDTGWETATVIWRDSSGSARYPHVAHDSIGNAMVVWQQGNETRTEIRASRFVVSLKSPIVASLPWLIIAVIASGVVVATLSIVMLWKKSESPDNPMNS